MLGADFLGVYQEVIETLEPLAVAQAIKRIQAALAHELSADQLPYNGGGLLIASLSRELPGVSNELAGLDVNESIISGTACAARLTDVRIARLDVRAADLSRITFANCQVTDLIVDELTRFGATKPEVHALHVVEAGSASTLRVPEEIHAWLVRHSSSVNGAEGSEQLPLVRLFDRVCRRSMRQSYLRHGNHDPGGELLSNRLWPEIEAILEQEGYLDRQMKPASGPPTPLLRVKTPWLLLAPPVSDEGALRVRERVIARAKELAG